jgi:hypothetical protein
MAFPAGFGNAGLVVTTGQGDRHRPSAFASNLYKNRIFT